MTAESTKDNGNYSLRPPFNVINRLKDNIKVKDGLGILFWPDGTKYEGQFSQDVMSGNGRKIFANGEYYIGLFENDKANGYGVFKDLNGGRYEGEWKEDK